MSEAIYALAPLYASALEAHLNRSGEHALHQAYELGRLALTQGVGMLDLTQAHHEALARLMLDHEPDRDTFDLAAQFLSEALSPFEMMLRGYQEANGRLSAANKELTQAHAALGSAHEQLKAEVEERKKAEEELLHAKKLQAIGLLAGGVAHHFNNLLTVVLGNLELARRRLSDDDRTEQLLLAARRGAERGVDVTRQLLSFSRQQMLQPETLALGAWLSEIRPLLASTLRGDITVETSATDDLAPIRVDPGQLELAILNLAVNARDAMPTGGTLRISAQNTRLSDRRSELSGDYVTIEVSDTGQGVPPDILSRVFEPFFTTKGGGPGAGLGLSQVHGFVHQSGGMVEMENRPGGGALVRMYLPAAADEAAADGEKSDPETPEHEPAAGRVLVVEDDVDLARLASDLLQSLGYSVTLAYRAQAALDLLRKGETVDLVFSDVVMPGGMNGVQLADELRRRFPRLPVLLTSGFNDAVESLGAQGVPFIPKPYKREDLRQGIGKLLDQRSATAPS